MRTLTLAMVVATASGCWPFGASHSHDQAPRLLVIDKATVEPRDQRGGPWCANQVVPSFRVRLTFEGVTRETQLAAIGFAPVWNVPTFAAQAGEFSSGIAIDVHASCGATETSVGAITIHPGPAAVTSGGLVLSKFGAVDELRLHFSRTGSGGYAGAGGAADSGGVDSGDYYYYDDSSDDGDPGAPVDDGSSWDDSSWDACGCSDGSGDSGGGYYGGDTSGDYGGDYGGGGYDDGSSDSGSADDGSGDDGGGDGSELHLRHHRGQHRAYPTAIGHH